MKKQARERGLRVGIAADDVSYCVNVEGCLPLQRQAFVVGLRYGNSRVVVSFVPGYGRSGERYWGDGEDGEEEAEGVAEHVGRLGVGSGQAEIGRKMKNGIGKRRQVSVARQRREKAKRS
jgi:hypothetical protein